MATGMKRRNNSFRHRGKALQFVPPGAFETPALHQHMFQQDVQLMGHFSRSRRDEKPALRFEGGEEGRTKADSLCASIAGGPHYRPEENISGAIEDVVLHLAYHGNALFEIVADPENSALSLSSFNPSYVWNLLFFYLQTVPRDSWQYAEGRYAFLAKSAVWRVDMPHELGGARGFRRILKEMSAWSSLGPEFYQDDLKRRQLPKEFVFGDYQRAHQTQLYRVTRDWGWGGRDWSLAYVTEYYQFYRHLTFKWAQAVLREHVVRELNSLFHRLGISAKIVMEGLSSPGEILKVREQMQAGVLDFTGATKAIR